MPKDKTTSNEKSPFDVGDTVKFKLEKKKNSLEPSKKKLYKCFLIGFKSNDIELEDKYHDKVVINNKNLKMVKKN